MRTIRSIYLIAAIVLVSVLAEVSYYTVSSDNRIHIGHFLIFLNLLIAVAGLWTPYRGRWAAYLLVSAALTILVGAVTPLSAAGILARLLAPN